MTEHCVCYNSGDATFEQKDIYTDFMYGGIIVATIGILAIEFVTGFGFTSGSNTSNYVMRRMK